MNLQYEPDDTEKGAQESLEQQCVPDAFEIYIDSGWPYDLSPLNRVEHLRILQIRDRPSEALVERGIDFTPITNLKELEVLWLPNFTVDNLTLQFLNKLENLRSIAIELSNSDLTDVEMFRNLEVVSISASNLEEGYTLDMSPFASECLKIAQFHFIRGPTFLNLEPLSKCKQLEKLRIDENPYAEGLKNLDLTPLKNCNKFKLLIAKVGCSINFSNKSNVEILELDVKKDIALEFLKGWKLLKQFRLRINVWQSELIVPIKYCENLVHLSIKTDAQGPSIDLDQLTGHPKLKELIIDCINMRSYFHDSMKIPTITSLEKVSINRGERLKSLDLSGLANNENLRRFDTSYCSHLKNLDLSPLTSCNNLERLSLSANTTIDLTPLSGHMKLTGVSIGYLYGGEDGSWLNITPLLFCPNLTVFSCSGYETEIRLDKSQYERVQSEGNLPGMFSHLDDIVWY